MEDFKYDVAVIGGGSAGYAAARTAAAAEKKVVVIDGGEELGGLCILRGCMPSKTLIETANRTLAIREAEEFGIKVGESKVDMKALIARKKELIDDFRGYRAEQLQDGRFDLVRGHAKFLDSETLEVSLLGSEKVQIVAAKSTIVATGSSIFAPSISGLEETGYLTSDDVLDMDEAPDSIIVLGGGAIALEMAHFYEGIGKDVTLIQRGAHLLTGMDHDVADELQVALTSRGMTIYCDTEILEVKSEGGKKVITFNQNGEERRVVADEILCALGRQPNIGRLNLENAGIELEDGRIKVSLNMQSTAANIFTAGDVCGPYEIVHLAIEQGEMAAENAILYLKGSSQEEYGEMDYRLKLYGIFSEPQVASVGITEIEAKEKGVEVLVETYPFNDHGKSMVHGSKYGFVKLIACAETKEILGGAVVGPEGVELIHEVVVAMGFRATASQLAKIPHYHPTLSEIWTYPAEDIADS